MSDRWNSERRDEEDEEDGEYEFTDGHYKAQKDALIFAIQVTDSMLQPPAKSDDKKASKDPACLTALKCAYQVMQQRIISNPKDMIAIILFGTEKTKIPGDIRLQDSSCYLLTDLDVPAAEDVKDLRGLVEEGENADEILASSKRPADMVMLLRLVLHLFQTRAPNFGSRRLFIITDDDDPCAGIKKNPSWDPAVGAKDIHDHGCTIELFPITREDSKFDTTKFYDDIIYHDPILDEANPGAVAPAQSGDGLNLLHSLVSNINSRQTPKRAYFSNMPLEIGPGLTISVKGYNIIQKQAPARSCYIWLDGEKPQVALGETARLAEDSARAVEKFEVKKAYKFGNEYVYFTDEEQKSIKQFGGTCIRVIGFKDRSLLQPWAAIKKSTYVFPSEEGYVGSTRVFTALWHKLLKSKKVGMAWHIARRNANPQLVAIIPSRATSDESSGTQFMPAGLWLYPIPFIDDVRDAPEMGAVIRTTNALTDRMNKVVQQLQLPGGIYNPSKYPNPALQWHYKILQALALDDVVPDQPEDATVPKHRAIHKRCGGYIQEWSQVADDVLGQIQEQNKIKRELDNEGEEEQPRPVKKSRTTAARNSAADGDGLSNEELRKRYDAGTLSKLTVADLRAMMSGRGLETKGLKKDLVERLEQWVEANVKMDALGLSNARSNATCSSLEDLQGQLYQLLAAKSSDTRAEHISPSFELLSHTNLYLPIDPDNSAAEGTGAGPGPDAAQPQQPPLTRTVITADAVQNQPTDDPVIQKAVAKHICNAIGAVDQSEWTVRQVTRGAQGWQFTYICKGSLQAWNRANGKDPKRPTIGSYSGSGGLDPINLSRPAFDCRGTLSIAFSKSSRAIIVKYGHTPLHQTVHQLVERLVPAAVPVPVSNANISSQRTPKPKRSRPVDGEQSSRKKKTPKEKPSAVDGEESNRKKRTPRPKRPRQEDGADGEGSKKKRRKSNKAPEADMGAPEQDRNANEAPSNNSAADKAASTGFLNVPPAEAERRRQTAIELLQGKGIDPDTLSSEQFNIFANQAPNLQSASLDMLARYGAERLRIVHPEEKEQAASSSSTPAAAGHASTTSTATVPAAPSGSATAPTRKSKAKKRKSDGPLAEVSIGNGAVVPLEQDGEIGTTESSLKPRATRIRKTHGRCDTCRLRNAQCTKEHPSCSTCVEAGSEKPAEEDETQQEAGTQGQEVPAPVGPNTQNSTVPLQPPPDTENDEFIPDPNILSGPAEHRAHVIHHANTNESNYFQESHNGISFPQIPNAPSTAGGTTMPGLTYSQPQTQHNEHVAHPAASVAFSSTSVHPQQTPHNPLIPQSSSASTAQHDQHEQQLASSSGRKSLPTSQSKQSPIPAPAVPAHAPNWTPSPSMHQAQTTSPKVVHQAAKRSKSRKAKTRPKQQGHDSRKQAVPQSTQYQSPMTRSPYQSAAYVHPRQGQRSQSNTPVASNPRPPPPPQAPSTATHQAASSTSSYSVPTTTSSAPNYNTYARYNNNGNEQYNNPGNDHNPSRLTYESNSYQTNTNTTNPPAFTTMPSHDYGRASGALNPLSQALNGSAAYAGNASATANKWPTSQTRDGQPEIGSSAYALPTNSAPTSHGYGTRTSDTRTSAQNPPYNPPQSQNYNSYSQQSNLTQQNQHSQSQQNWYGMSAANNSNQANYANNRSTGHSNHRSTAPPYSSLYGGHDEQAIYDLLRAGSSNH
ncbi:hypothetical protein F4808DRAFT_453647 [Astrocystis sublimbata]|nr:hypothetical protein F4808DRAFT_453647 [Astrocystis sublimbata]